VDDDGRLVERYRGGDNAAFDELVHRHGPVLFAFLLSRLRDRVTAEDLLQEVFLHALKGLPRYRHRGRFRAWLFRIAHNAVADHGRRAGRAKLLPLDSPPPGADAGAPALADQLPGPESERPDRVAERREAAAVVREAAERLPALQREVFLMRQAGLTFREIARLQRCPLNTALGRMHDAVQALRRTVRP
jgi:RNA polymerase sigma-70 factor (ECF subfamily)